MTVLEPRQRTVEPTPKGGGRIHSLDFLRGAYITLAVGQHFTALLTQVGFPMMPGIKFLFWLLSPSGEQLFLALAAFNLAKRKCLQFREVAWQKIAVFAVLFGLFVVESFLGALSLEGALTWGPLLSWMVILALLTAVYALFGAAGVAALFLLQMVLWLESVQTLRESFGGFLNNHAFFAEITYQSPVEMFVGAGALGFLLGYLHHQTNFLGDRREAALITLGLLLLLPFALFGTTWVVDPEFVWEEESVVVSQFSGAVSIWGSILIIIGSALFCERLGLPIRAPLFNWIGRYSLLIFALHQVLFVRIMMPLHLTYGEAWGIPPDNSFVQLCAYFAIELLIVYAILTSRLLLMLHYQGALTGPAVEVNSSDTAAQSTKVEAAG